MLASLAGWRCSASTQSAFDLHQTSWLFSAREQRESAAERGLSWLSPSQEGLAQVCNNPLNATVMAPHWGQRPGEPWTQGHGPHQPHNQGVGLIGLL